MSGSSEAHDIRVWAQANGWDLGDRGRIPGDARAAYEARADDETDEEPELDFSEGLLFPPAAGGPESNGDGPGLPDVGPPMPERRPERQPRPPRQRGAFRRKAREPGKRKTRVARARVSVESLISSGWGLGAFALAQAPKWVPVARVLDMQSPVAGIVVEDAVKGTGADKVLQPFARMAANGGRAGALLGLPALVALVTAQPQLFPVARPVLRLLLVNWLELAGPAMDKARQRAERLESALAGVDIDGMLDSLWAGVPVDAEPSPDEEAAVRRARGE
jgi:hypothetical protein